MRWVDQIMAVIEVGRICVKTRGRDAGKKVVIVDIIDENFVLITGPKDVNGVKRKRSNILHIDATDKKVEIKKGASDDEVKNALQQASLLDFMKETIKPKMTVI
ncbi:50S ribosomal protein L14e [Sulfuracidifex tepidarius]|uniref:Large ribosomal subunit protein eL14 n=2 Tax=Sulfuracidifex tepidarius TaxID=1294262 RepID=A0A510DVE1_9CREN|nr:50S ribosomal protein L14e [Sulfuracidifex tepidarius]BBG26938.1 50S ribosomal protein L14e [Sulfuracidifex tepidarius]